MKTRFQEPLPASVLYVDPRCDVSVSIVGGVARIKQNPYFWAMCGRYKYTLGSEALEARIGGTYEDVEPRKSINVAPQTYNPVAVGLPTKIKLAKWGIIPRWSKDGKMTYPTFNARAEELHEKATFKNLIAKQRCLVPMDSFYEWREVSKGVKIPFEISQPGDIMVAAGLWETWRDPSKPEGENTVRSFTIITTEATEAMQGIHTRMPLFLPHDWEKVWVDTTTSLEVVNQIRFSRPTIELLLTERDPALNSVKYQPEVR